MNGRFLSEDITHDMSVNVCQTEVASLELEGQPLVIDAEQVHPGGLQVMNMDSVFDGVHAEFV